MGGGAGPGVAPRIGALLSGRYRVGAFHAAGIPFVYFGVEDHPDYHRPSDEVATITPGFYVNAVRTIAAAIRELDAALR